MTNSTIAYEKDIYGVLFLIDEQGELYVPEGVKVLRLYVENDSIKTHYFRYKTTNTFKEACFNVYQKLRTKPVDYRYTIDCVYQTKEGRQQTETLCWAKKTETGIHISFKRFGDYSPAPSGWFPTPRKNTTSDELITVLKEKYNVKEVVFRQSVNQKRKEDFLRRIQTYFQTLEGIVDFYAFPALTIATSTMKKWGGTYEDDLINLIIGKEYVFYHEYFHHLDYATKGNRLGYFDDEKRVYTSDIEAEKKYFSLLYALENDETMMSYYQANKWMLNEYNSLKLSHLSSKRGRYYLYWIRAEEITARFFEDLMFEKVNEKLPEECQSNFRNYSKEEIKTHQKYMWEFIDELNTLMKSEKDK